MILTHPILTKILKQEFGNIPLFRSRKILHFPVEKGGSMPLLPLQTPIVGLLTFLP